MILSEYLGMSIERTLEIMREDIYLFSFEIETCAR